ncbi:hypothetical protein CL617_00995 [archaeon]|nr:hypothetical protein [archaeon]|tara:strand:- start:1135 stop:3513 length:2379 start_codon:yes stop_codon:yes gene_type:complete
MVGKINNNISYSKSEIGGKAHNLMILKEKEFDVPDFFVIPHTQIKGNRFEDLSTKIVNSIKDKDRNFILRSSAIGEDSSENSFAGMFESTRVRDNQNIDEELNKVLESENSERVLFYLKSKNIKEKPRLSVIVQDFIDGDVSGVMFTSLIKNGKKGTMINSNFGSSSVVDGSDSDSYFINRENILSKKVINNKPSLTEEQIKSLIKLGNKIEGIFSSPQDIEWTIKGSKIYVIQTRPITSKLTKDLRIWDNSNIAESFSGIVLPLTASYARYAYKETFTDLARRSLVSEKKIREYDDVFENLLGFFYGRFYYNMLNWYKMITLYPGYERNKKNFEDMISAKSRHQFDNDYKENVSTYFKIKYYSTLVIRYPFFDREVQDFIAHVQSYNSDFNKIDLESMSSKELLNLYYESTKQLLKKWSITVENDFLLMTFFGSLRKFCKKNRLKEEDFLSLVSNIKNVVSAEQVDLLKELSDDLKDHKDLYNLSKNKEYSSCLREIHINPQYKNLKLGMSKYLEKYGGRFANELKLESEDLDTNPEFMIKLLVNYSNTDIANDFKVQLRDFNLSIKESIKLNFLTRKIKHYARKREELRLLRAQSFALARKLFISIGNKFMDQDILDNARDIFYLEVGEIIRQIEGSSVTVKLKEVVKLRKRQYLDFKDKEIDDVFFTEGDPYLSLPSKSSENNQMNLKGEGCSPGIIKGKVKILDSFEIPDNEEYDIIVTKHTDPGWTPLFGLCKGLIVEHGGLLSHAAIISRELNLPCVIGIRDATRNLKDGQIVTINGYTGEVKIHE